MSLNDYLTLFPSCTRDLHRFYALAEAVLRQATVLIALIPSLESGFSVDGAAGAQLDALGASFFTPRQLGWDDDTYRNVLRRKLKRVNWDGRNGTVSEFLSDGDSVADHDNWTVTVRTEDPLPLPACDLLPIVIGERVVSGQ